MNLAIIDLSLVDRPHLKHARDGFMDFKNDLQWDSPIHQPISWHSYACAMGGKFVCAPDPKMGEVIELADVVIATFNYNPKAAQKIIEAIKKLGKIVISAYHEGGNFLHFELKRNPRLMLDFRECVNASDAFFAHVKADLLGQVYRGFGVTVPILKNIPQATHIAIRDQYLVDPKEKSGVFVGSRFKDFEIEQRNFFYSVACAVNEIRNWENLDKRIVVQNASQTFTNDYFQKLLSEMHPDIKFEVYGMLSFHEYAKLIATCQYTINLDNGDLQGQCDHDSLFVGTDLMSWIAPQISTDCQDQYKEFLDVLNSKSTPDIPEHIRYENIEAFLLTYCTYASCKAELTEAVNDIKNADFTDRRLWLHRN